MTAPAAAAAGSGGGFIRWRHSLWLACSRKSTNERPPAAAATGSGGRLHRAVRGWRRDERAIRSPAAAAARRGDRLRQPT
jgi:hypothetical protein